MATVFDLQAVRQALDAGDAASALTSAQQAADAFPDNAAALALQGEALLALERWQEGLAVVDKVLQMEPTSSWGYRLRCVALGNLGRNEEQIAAARRAVELTPQEPNAYFLLGKALWQTSREVPARGAITRAVELAPDVPLYRFTLAQILFDAEPKQAEEMLRRIVTDDPRHAAALNELGVLAQRGGRLKEARTLYERAARADPLLTAARHNLEQVGYPVSRWKLGLGLGLVMLAGPTAGSAFAAVWLWRDGHGFPALSLAALSALSSLLAVVTFGQALEAKRRPRAPLRS